MNCRFCESNVTRSFVDLGHQPPSNNYLTKEQLVRPEVTYPLQVFVCEECWLVQLPAHAHAGDLFTEDYSYFSSVSSSWVEHARQYVEMVIQRFNLSKDSLVVELASNDGYLLQFVTAVDIPCVGIEPTASTARASRAKGIETIEEFFGTQFAKSFRKDRGKADLILGNNVLAHVPDINDFVKGVAELLSHEGVVTFEFPHLMELVDGLQFDTIYHEHYSYLSFTTVNRIFESLGLRMFDVEKLPTHGGSLRVYGTPTNSSHQTSQSVTQLLDEEEKRGMSSASFYEGFQPRVNRCKNMLLEFLLEKSKQRAMVAAYGAAAKGNTFLNYAGVRSDLIQFVCDAAESKQGKFLPASHIPILPPDVLEQKLPDSIVVLPWNISKEILSILQPKLPNCEFVTAIPELKVWK